MTSGRPGRFSRRANDDPAAVRAKETMTATFLDMDRRQSIADTAVSASTELFPESRMQSKWEPIRDRCYQATGAYLALTEQPAAVAAAYDHVTQQLLGAARAVDEFYLANRGHLEQARATLATVPQLGQAALAAAESALTELDNSDARYADYPSVKTRVLALDSALSALEAARVSGRASAVREAANNVNAEAAAVEHALADAPRKDQDARNALSSVRTRVEAVQTKSEGLAPAYSALLREFNVASSADLTGNDVKARESLTAASELVRAAVSSSEAGNPERALELTATARKQLSDAEQRITAVTSRLSTLRSVRDNPAAKADEIRFKLRDAQMLVVNRGLTAEWASVLDAQLDRIDRVADQLTGRHPDYWSYIQGLDTIATFIAGVVDRVRNEPQSGGR